MILMNDIFLTFIKIVRNSKSIVEKYNDSNMLFIARKERLFGDIDGRIEVAAESSIVSLNFFAIIFSISIIFDLSFYDWDKLFV